MVLIRLQKMNNESFRGTPKLRWLPKFSTPELMIGITKRATLSWLCGAFAGGDVWSLFLNDKKNRIEKERYVIQKGFAVQTIPTPPPPEKKKKKKVMKHSNFQLFVVV